MQGASALFRVVDAHQRKDAGDQLLQRGEALGGHPGLYLDNLTVVAHLLGHRLAGQLSALGVVVDREAGLGDGVGHRAAIGLGDALDHFLHVLVEGQAHLFPVEEPDSAAEGQVVGDDIAHSAGLQDAHRKGQRVKRGDLGQTGRLKGIVHSHEAVNRAVGLVGTGAVAALAVDGHVEAHGGGHGVAGIQRHLAALQPGVQMGAVYGIRGDAVLVHIGEHIGRTGPDLLRPLEEEDHLAVDLLLVLGENLGGAQQHGHVAVMAAGVHYTGVLAAAYPLLGQVVLLLLNRQRVAVGTQQHRLAWLCALNIANDAAMGDDFIGDAHLVQLFTQPLDGLILVVGELRMLVEIPPHLDHIGLYRFCKLIHFHGNSPPGSLPAAGTGSLPLRQNLTFCKGPRAISPGTYYIHFTLSPRKLQDGKDNLYLLYQNDGDFFRRLHGKS